MSHTSIISATRKAKALRAYMKSSIPEENLVSLTFPNPGEFNDSEVVE